MVNTMDGMTMTINVAKSFLGKNVNLHLKDGSVIVNVRVDKIQKDPSKREILLKCIPYGQDSFISLPLKRVSWAKMLDINLIQVLDRKSN